MDIVDFENHLRSLVRERGYSTTTDIKSIDAKLVEFPNSAALWILRGDLIQLCDDYMEYEIKDALQSYQAAVEREPANPEGYEEIGYYLDAIKDRPREAEYYFRRAIELGAGKSAHDGLARVLEQLKVSE